MAYPQSVIYFLIILHIYLNARFAVQCSFKFSGVYHFKYFIITALVPIAGYFIAVGLVKRKQANFESE